MTFIVKERRGTERNISRSLITNHIREEYGRVKYFHKWNVSTGYTSLLSHIEAER